MTMYLLNTTFRVRQIRWKGQRPQQIRASLRQERKQAPPGIISKGSRACSEGSRGLEDGPLLYADSLVVVALRSWRWIPKRGLELLTADCKLQVLIDEVVAQLNAAAVRHCQRDRCLKGLAAR